MSWPIWVGLLALILAAAGWALARFGASLVLRSHGADEAAAGQAPLAQGLLAELAAAAGIDPPRLFVIPAWQPNGLAVASSTRRIVAVTEGVFDKLDAAQMRGLLALLVAGLARPRARFETAVAALALIVAPFVFPSLALVRLCLRGDRWLDIDLAAAALVGAGPIADTLETLESARGDSAGITNLVTASLFCVNPGGPTSMSWLDKAT